MALHTDLPIYKQSFELSKLISQVVANMQKDHKFVLGRSLHEQCFDLVMGVYHANSSSSDRVGIIQGMREKVVAIELSMRLAVDLERMSRRHHAKAIKLTQSIGRQLTGWKEHTEKRQQVGRQGGRSSVHR